MRRLAGGKKGKLMTAVLTFWDAAYPQQTQPNTDGVCFYIGGDTLHVWTATEVALTKARYRLPVFVRSNPSGASPAGDVTVAVTRLHQLGAPAGCLVAWDMEMASDPGYISAVYRGMRTAGYEIIVYGSQSTVFGNQNPDGLYWGADWTNVPHLHSGDAITQYVDFGPTDQSEALSTLPFWDTHTKAPVTPPTSPPPQTTIPAWQEALMKALPVVKKGMTGTAVKTVQGLCCSRGYITAIDGNFGAGTESAVASVQKAASIAGDGVVGANTWPVLMGIA
jgi:hypothetical protein